MSKYYIDPNWCWENPEEAAAELERLHKWCDELEAERDALAAHVEEAKRIFEDTPEVDPHPHGWVLAVDIAAAQDWIDGMPTTSLARLKTQWQAEALEAVFLELEPISYRSASIMAIKAAEFLRQAEGGE